MKRTFLITLAIGFMTAGLGLQGQDLNIVTVDMNRLYNEYYKTIEANERIKGSFEKAQEQVEEMVNEGQTLLEDYKSIIEMTQNDALTEEARLKAQTDAESMAQQLKDKEREIQQFRQNTQRSVQQRQQTYRDLFLDEIKGIVLEVSRERKGDLILDTSGITALGIPGVIYSDPSWDVTELVMERINADAPEDE